MISTPTIAVNYSNLNRMLETIKFIDPELYLFKMSCLENGVSPMVGKKLNEQLGNIALGSGFGKVTVSVKEGVVVGMEGMESVRIEEAIRPKQMLLINEEITEITEIF